jgi:hypothetical protein
VQPTKTSTRNVFWKGFRDSEGSVFKHPGPVMPARHAEDIYNYQRTAYYPSTLTNVNAAELQACIAVTGLVTTISLSRWQLGRRRSPGDWLVRLPQAPGGCCHQLIAVPGGSSAACLICSTRQSILSKLSKLLEAIVPRIIRGKPPERKERTSGA